MSENTRNGIPPRDEPEPQAKRSERHGPDSEAQTTEFADDMLTNRFTPPPPPGDEKDD